MKFLTEWIDVVVFGLVVVGAFAALLGGHATGRPTFESAHESTVAAVATVDKALAENRYERDDGFRILAVLADVPGAVENQWSPPVPSPRPTPDLFAHPEALEDLRAGREAELRFPAPLAPQAEADLGVIRLGWSRDPQATVPIVKWRVYRTDPGGEEKAIATLGFDATSYEDRQVQAGALYSYRVTALTDEPLLVRRDRAESPRSRAVTIRGKKDYEIKPLAFDDATQTMRVLVRKHANGIWHEKEFEARRGEPIGQKDPGSGVDYGTLCRADSFDIRRDSESLTRDEVVFDEKARVLLDGDRPRTRTVTTNRPVEVVVLGFTNEVGATETLELRRRP